MKLSIILPAYNEGDHIQAVIEQVLRAKPKILEQTDFQDVELVVVNDGSKDTTRENVESLLRQKPNHFIFYTYDENQGYGAALKAGFNVATGDYLSFMDADGTIDPLSFISMYQGLKTTSSDMALGRRFGNMDSKMPPIRKAGNYFFASLLSFLSGEHVSDTASGVRLFKKDILTKLYPLPDGMHFTPAMSSKALHEKIKIVEVPIQYDVRSGESKLSIIKDGYRFLRIILGTVLLYNPFKVFSLIGSLLVLVAAILVAKPIYIFFSLQDLIFTDYIYRSIIAMYFFVSGCLVILFGILARFLVSTFFRMYETGQLIHILNQKLKVYHRMSWYGFAVFAIGMAVNTAYVLHYFIEKTLKFHWAWLLFAAGLIIIGLQMMITGLIMKIVTKIRQTIDYQ